MNMQAQRPQPQSHQSLSRSHEAREHHSAACVSAHSKIEFYSHRGDHDDRDDGLVHGHFWAMSTTVR